MEYGHEQLCTGKMENTSSIKCKKYLLKVFLSCQYKSLTCILCRSKQSETIAWVITASFIEESQICQLITEHFPVFTGISTINFLITSLIWLKQIYYFYFLLETHSINILKQEKIISRKHLTNFRKRTNYWSLVHINTFFLCAVLKMGNKKQIKWIQNQITSNLVLYTISSYTFFLLLSFFAC